MQNNHQNELQCHYSPKKVFLRNQKKKSLCDRCLPFCKTFGDKTNFIYLNITHWICFDYRYLSTTYGFHTFRQFDDIPNVMFNHQFYYIINDIRSLESEREVWRLIFMYGNYKNWFYPHSPSSSFVGLDISRGVTGSYS